MAAGMAGRTSVGWPMWKRITSFTEKDVQRFAAESLVQRLERTSSYLIPCFEDTLLLPVAGAAAA